MLLYLYERLNQNDQGLRKRNFVLRAGPDIPLQFTNTQYLSRYLAEGIGNITGKYIQNMSKRNIQHIVPIWNSKTQVFIQTCYLCTCLFPLKTCTCWRIYSSCYLWLSYLLIKFFRSIACKHCISLHLWFLLSGDLNLATLCLSFCAL